MFGVEHSWLNHISVTENNEALVNQKHFYDYKNSKSKTMHYGGKRVRKLHEILHKFYLSFKAYKEISNYVKNKETQIYNCTKGSFIDAFDRIKPENITSVINESPE